MYSEQKGQRRAHARKLVAQGILGGIFSMIAFVVSLSSVYFLRDKSSVMGDIWRFGTTPISKMRDWFK